MVSSCTRPTRAWQHVPGSGPLVARKIYDIRWPDNAPTLTAAERDTYAGKSHYIAASIHQLREGKMTQIDRYARFIRLNPEIEEQYLQKFFNPLFKQKQQLPGNLPATSPINDPLIYEMVFEGAINPSRIKHLNMLIYDAAGGDLANQDVMVDVARFVLNADALIFLADPMSMEGIVEQLPFHLRNNPTSGRRASDVLNWVIQTLERARNLEAGARLPIPVQLWGYDSFAGGQEVR